MNRSEQRLRKIERSLGVGKTLVFPSVFYHVMGEPDDIAQMGEFRWERGHGEDEKSFQGRVSREAQILPRDKRGIIYFHAKDR